MLLLLIDPDKILNRAVVRLLGIIGKEARGKMALGAVIVQALAADPFS